MRRVLLHLPVLAAFLLLVQACGFVQSAGDIEVGKGTIPEVQYDLRWPKVDDLIGDTLKSGSTRVPGAPTSLEASTLAHVQGIMTIDGSCHRAFDQAEIKPAGTATTASTATAALKNLHVEVVNCGDPSRCRSRCDGFHGMRLEARVQIQLLDQDKANKIKKAFPNPSPGAVTSIRAQFSRLDFYELKGAKLDQKVSVDKLFAGYELGLSSPGGGDDTVLIHQRDLSRISPETPQRFELDPTAPFTAKIKAAVLSGQPQWVEVFQRFDVAEADLYSFRLGNAGVDIRFQPEFVINAIEVAQNFLK